MYIYIYIYVLYISIYIHLFVFVFVGGILYKIGIYLVAVDIGKKQRKPKAKTGSENIKNKKQNTKS